MSGEFFVGLSAPQFATVRAVRLVADGLGGSESWWCAGRDPAALWGLGQAGEGVSLPRRAAGCAAAFAGARPVLAFSAGGGRIETVLAPDDPSLPAALAPLKNLLVRRVLPEPRIVVTSINDTPAGESPYLPLLRQLFEAVREPRGLVLFKGRSGLPQPAS